MIPELEAQTLKKEKAKTGFLRVWTAIGAIALFGAALYFMGVISSAMSILLWTLIITFCLRGIVNGLDKRGVRRGLGTTIAFLVMFAVVTLFFVMMFSPSVGFGGQLADVVANVPAYANAVINAVSEFYDKYAYLLGNDTIKSWLDTIGASIASWASGFAASAAQIVVQLGSGLVNSLIIICFSLVIAFWVLMGLPQLGREVKRVLGPKYEEDAVVWHLTMTRVVGGYIKAALLQCLIVGICAGVICGIAGVRNPGAWGLIVGVFTIVPVIGSWIGAALCGIAGIFVTPVTGLIVFVGIVVAERIVLTFIGPKIIGDTVDIHPVLTLIALSAGSAIGAALGGLGGSIVGMLICVPLTAAVKALFVYYFEKRTGRQIVSADGFFFKGLATEEDDFDPLADASSGARLETSEEGITVRLPIQGKKTHGEAAGPDAAADAARALESLAGVDEAALAAQVEAEALADIEK